MMTQDPGCGGVLEDGGCGSGLKVHALEGGDSRGRGWWSYRVVSVYIVNKQEATHPLPYLEYDCLFRIK